MASVKRNYFYNLVVQILQVILPFITTPYISRILGPENIGTASYVLANFVYFQLIGNLGLSSYAQIEGAKVRENKALLSKFFAEIFIVKIIMTVVSGSLFAFFIFMTKEYSFLYSIQFVSLIGYSIDISWLYEAIEDFKSIMLRNLSVKFIGVALIFLLIKDPNDLWKYILINSISIMFGSLCLYIGLWKIVNFRDISDLRIIRHFKLTLVFFLPSIASVIMATADKIMIGVMSVSKVQNAYYEQAIKIENMFFSFFTALFHTMKSRISFLYAKGQTQEVRAKMEYSIQFLSLLSLPIAVGLFVIADIFVPFFFGRGFESTATILMIMTPWIVIKPLGNCLLDQYMASCGLQNKSMKIIWIGMLTNVILNYCLINNFGAVGAAVASLVSETLIMILAWKCSKLFMFSDWFRFSWKYCVASLTMGIVTLTLKFLLLSKINIINNICIIVISGVVTYVLMVFALRDDLAISQINQLLGKWRIKK